MLNWIVCYNYGMHGLYGRGSSGCYLSSSIDHIDYVTYMIYASSLPPPLDEAPPPASWRERILCLPVPETAKAQVTGHVQIH